MPRALFVLPLLALTACHSSNPLGPIQEPAPIRNAGQGAEYAVLLGGIPEVEGRVVHAVTSARDQLRGILFLRGGVVYRSVRETRRVDGVVTSFRYVERSRNRELDLTGAIEAGLAEVSDHVGERVAELEWTERHRFGEAWPADLVATGFEPGATTELVLYLPWHDPTQGIATTYTVEGPEVFTRSDGERIPAHRVRVTSTREGDPGTVNLVDERGRLLRSSTQLAAAGFEDKKQIEMTFDLLSRWGD